MLLLKLNGQWQMKRTDEAQWNSAVVPGSVYNDLINAGKLEDPFYRDNEYDALQLSNWDYEYQTGFIVDADMISHDKIFLLCEGLDTLCDLFLNEHHILFSNNMHRTYEIDVKRFLIKGDNHIHAVFKSPIAYITQKQAKLPLRNSDDALPGISHLRKAHYMFGWDWGAKLPDMGIWRGISLQSFVMGRFTDVYITQKHQSGKVDLDIRVQVENWSASSLQVFVKVISPSGSVLTEAISVINKEEYINFRIDQPELWWPNNLGEQPLYKVQVYLMQESKTLDTKEYKIGLRTLTVKQQDDQWGRSFEIEVNGISIFSMGADYIPEDNILARCNRERTEAIIKSCVEANFNTIRVWGGAYYPEDYFYDLCDEYGLIVWQDLMFACGVYELSTEFKETVTHEIIDNMKRIRHHASLGLWCGNNEQEWGWVAWGWSDNYSAKLKVDYIKLFEVLLPEIAQKIDPETFYWLASPSSTGSFNDPNSENYGDMHFWGVWHRKLPFTDYRKIFPRYMSEFGLQSFPCLKTINTFTIPEDRNIYSYVMESHQKNGTGNEKILYYIGENYKLPKDFDSLLYASQLIQAEGMRYGVEHWRRNRGRCMGAVYWQLNDSWPVASWASIDYFGRWKALHYAAKRFFSPILISACEEGTRVSLHVSNETMNNVSGQLCWKLMNNKSVEIASSKREVQMGAFKSAEVETLDFADILNTKNMLRNSYLEYSFEINDKIVSTGTVLFTKAKHFNFTDPQIKAKIQDVGESYIVELTSKAFAYFVEVDFKSLDVVFSDNYFDLSAPNVKAIEIKKEYVKGNVSTEELYEQLTVRSIFDTYV